MLKKTSIICLMFALGLMFSLCGTLAAETIDVDIANFSFSPQTITINEGDTVIWTNRDSTAHTSTSGTPSNRDGIWDSGNLFSGQTFQFTFTSEGSFDYFCAIHPFMRGQVIVLSDIGTPPPVPKEDISIDIIVHIASKMASADNINDMNMLYDNCM